MKSEQWVRIGRIVCAVIVVCAAVYAVTNIFSGVGTYASADKYTAGDTEIAGTVKNIDISWTSGKVNVVYHAGNTVTVRETANRDLKDDQRLRWWLDGDTLRIRYAKSGFRLDWNLEKELTVELPEGTVLADAEISLTSGDVNVPQLKAGSLAVSVTSGDVQVAAEAEKAKFGSTSGDLDLKLTGETERIEIGSTSGAIRVEAEKAGTLKIGSTSGNIETTVRDSGKTEIGSTSGTVRVTLYKADELKVGTTSGSVTALLPAEPGFTAKVTMISGQFSTGLPVTKEGSRYVCGDGSMQAEIGTTSGSVRIDAAE